MRLRNSSSVTITPRWLITSLVAVGIVLLVYTIVRAARMEMTIDELHSLEHYANRFQIYPEQYGVWSANHHWLNSWSMRCSLLLFGDSPVSVRLPNILAHVIFLWFTARISLRFRNDVFALLIFILLNANPYLLDLFSLARGYGLMLGTMAASIYFLFIFIDKKRTRGLVWALLFASLAVLSNFVMLNFFFALFAVIVLAMIANKELRNKTNIVVTAAFAIALLGAVLPHIMQLQNNAGLDFGFTSLWNQTVSGLCWGLLYDVPYAGDNSFASLQLPIIVLTIFILVSALVLLRRDKLRYITSPHGILFLLLAGIITLMILQRYVLGTMYPPARSSVFIYFLFLLALAVSIQSVTTNDKLKKILLTLFPAIVTVHFIFCFNLRGVYEWKQASGSRDAINIIVREHEQKGTGEPVVLISGTISGPSLRWVADQQGLDWLQIIEHGSVQQPLQADYYFEEIQFQKFHSASEWVLLSDDPFAHNKLYRAR